jgi:hypothetical protein
MVVLFVFDSCLATAMLLFATICVQTSKTYLGQKRGGFNNRLSQVVFGGLLSLLGLDKF